MDIHRLVAGSRRAFGRLFRRESACVLILGVGMICGSSRGADIEFNIRFIGQSDPLESPSGVGFTYADVWSENGYAYVGSDRGGYGMSVFSLSVTGIPTFSPGPDWDPGDPFTPTYAGSEMEDVEVWDGIGYFASDVNGTTGRTGVDIVDLSIPFDPILLSRVDTSDCLVGNPGVCGHGKVHTISIQRINPGTPSEQRFMYTSDNSTSVVKITDVSDPSDPQLVTSLGLPFVNSSVDAHEVVVRNDRLYVASKNPGKTDPGEGDGWVHIYNVTNPLSPVLLKAFEAGTSAHTAMPTDDGKTLIVAEERNNGNVMIFDISMIDQPNDPQNPVLLATLNSSNVCYEGDCIEAHSPHHVHVHGNLLFLPWYEAGLQVFNIVNPATPVYVGAYDTFPGTASNYSGNWGVDLSHGLDRVLLSDRQRGLIVVDATGVVDPGDYNTDLIVNDEDYDAWVGAYGTTTSGTHNGPLADGNYDEMVDAADYVLWRKFVGAAGAGSTNVPEPAGFTVLWVAAGLTISLCRLRP